MIYTYRWIVAVLIFLIVVISGMISDGWPQYKTFQSLRRNEKQWQMIAAQTKQAALPKLKTLTFSERIYAMTQLAQANNVATVSMNIPASSSQTVHWMVQGHFQSLIHLLFSLVNGPSSVLINHVSFKTLGHQTLQVMMELDLASQTVAIDQSSAAMPTLLNDPFCPTTAPDYVMQKNAFATLQETPLEQLSLIGYMQQGKQQTAFILLPDNNTIAIKIGEIIGKERGSVIAISAQQVMVALPGSRSILIRRP